MDTVGCLATAIASVSPTPARLPELRELRSFAIAARTGNLGQAARHLNITSAAISQQLHKLEETLATRLLIRHSRGVSATPAGRELVRRTDAILRLLAGPLDGPRPQPAIEGTISVALPAEFGPLLAPALIAAGQNRFPHAILTVVETSEGALEAVCGGRVDIALLQDPPNMDILAIDRLVREDLGVVSAPDHKLAHTGLPLRLRELLAAPLILPNRHHWIRRLLAKAEQQRGLRFDTVAQVDSVPAIVAIVSRGLGCTLLPAEAVWAHAMAGALVFRPLTRPALTVTHAVAVRRDAPPEVRAFAAQTATLVRELAAGGVWPGARLLRPAAPPAQSRRAALPDALRVTIGSAQIAEGN